MSPCVRNILGLAAGGLILVAASAQPARAAQHRAPIRPGVPPAPVRPKPLPLTRPTVHPQPDRARPIGWDWWRIYPYSPYNAWKNPYWYPPYNNNYPFPPDEAHPPAPYPVPRPYPGPQPVPMPSPWGGIDSDGW